MTNNNEFSFEWVENNSRLLELSQQWQQQSAIALDTEFIRTRTFFPIIGLLQIADSQGIYLIDPLAITDLQPLRELLLNTQVVKVIHSCSEDLEVFDRYLGVVPQPLFDTQVAAAFAGFGVSVGYSSLLHQMLDLTISKQETRSNWLQRPLSNSQLDYAALDVAHLLNVYQQLRTQLENTKRLPWFESDCQVILDNFSEADVGNSYFLRIKSAWKLPSHQLAVLRNLCAWREQQVRDLDIPRSRLIKDTTLLDISKHLPENSRQLGRAKEIHSQFVGKFGEQCLQLVQDTLDDEGSHPQTLPPPLPSEKMNVLKQLKEQVVVIAEGLQMPPEILARKKDLEALFRLTQNATPVTALPASLNGWRKEVVAEPLLKFLSS